jgi:hypothetical protein
MAEEEILIELYAGGGGSTLFVREGWVGRLAAMNAALWGKVMKSWLEQNPNATRQAQLNQSRKLLDEMNLSIRL